MGSSAGDVNSDDREGWRVETGVSSWVTEGFTRSKEAGVVVEDGSVEGARALAVERIYSTTMSNPRAAGVSVTASRSGLDRPNDYLRRSRTKGVVSDSSSMAVGPGSE